MHVRSPPLTRAYKPRRLMVLILFPRPKARGCWAVLSTLARCRMPLAGGRTSGARNHSAQRTRGSSHLPRRVQLDLWRTGLRGYQEPVVFVSAATAPRTAHNVSWERSVCTLDATSIVPTHAPKLSWRAPFTCLSARLPARVLGHAQIPGDSRPRLSTSATIRPLQRSALFGTSLFRCLRYARPVAPGRLFGLRGLWLARCRLPALCVLPPPTASVCLSL